MTIEKLKSILRKKFKEWHPGFESYTVSLQIESSTRVSEKTKIRVFLSAHKFDLPMNDCPSEWYHANNVAEAVSILDGKINGYALNEKIDLE